MSRPPRRFALCNPAHGMTLPEVKAAIKSYLKMADILIRSPILRKLGLKQPGTGWHTFRRSLASWMNAAGASTFDVRDQLGHSSVETTGIYVQTGDRRTQIIMALQDRFLGVQTMKGGVN